jgi:hypothetical protein
MSVMPNIDSAVADYMDACDYKKVSQLTKEDLDYLACDLQIGIKDLCEILKLETV